jgi:hypothetical protein
MREYRYKTRYRIQKNSSYRYKNEVPDSEKIQVTDTKRGTGFRKIQATDTKRGTGFRKIQVTDTKKKYRIQEKSRYRYKNEVPDSRKIKIPIPIRYRTKKNAKLTQAKIKGMKPTSEQKF